MIHDTLLGVVTFEFVVGEINTFTPAAVNHYVIKNKQAGEMKNSAIVGSISHFNYGDDTDDLESSPGIVTEPTCNITRATSAADVATPCCPNLPMRIQMCAQTSGQTDIAVRHEGPP